MKKLRAASHGLATLLLISATAIGGCVTDTAEESSGKPEDTGKLVDGKADAWNDTNNPSRFMVDFEYAFDALPTQGAAETTPWPDTYWPTYKDSTNQRWQGQDELSPMEKYDRAFNGWEVPEGFMSLTPYMPSNCGQDFDAEYYEKLGPAAKWMSEKKGNWKAHDGIDNDGDGQTDECDDYDGVETWWGLCHAWVPAAILEKEPQRSVTLHGVTFEVGDIKALLITAYDRSSALMLGGRCNEKEVERDEHGRIKADHCRDTNAGAFHVVAANMLGIHKRSFAEDRTYDYEVWNQPFRSFEVLSQDEVDAKTAMAALGHEETSEYSFNDDAERFVKVRTRVRYISEPNQSSTEPLVPDVEAHDSFTGSDTYDYILELDADGEIIGGEWIGYSQTTHPDFLWLPIAARGGNPHVDLDLVHQLLELSTKEVAADGGGEAELLSYASAKSIKIPDNDKSGISDTITINDDVNIGSLNVDLKIDHSYIGDLHVTLEKDGLVVPLHERVGGGANDIDKSYEVSEFQGKSAKGVWTLKVSDRAAWDKGKLEGWGLLVNTAASAPAQHYEASGLPLAIPDNDSAGIDSSLTIMDEGAVKSAKLTIELKHSYVGDLRLELSHGGGTQVLHSREGGSSDDLVKTFELSAFGGSPLAGDWKLSVRDLAKYDVGTLESWSLSATTQ